MGLIRVVKVFIFFIFTLLECAKTHVTLFIWRWDAWLLCQGVLSYWLKKKNWIVFIDFKCTFLPKYHSQKLFTSCFLLLQTGGQHTRKYRCSAFIHCEYRCNGLWFCCLGFFRFHPFLCGFEYHFWFIISIHLLLLLLPPLSILNQSPKLNFFRPFISYPMILCVAHRFFRGNSFVKLFLLLLYDELLGISFSVCSLVLQSFSQSFSPFPTSPFL